MITLEIAKTDQHFAQILDLQRRYHADALPPDVHAAEGFVYARHTASLLRRMTAELPQAIALDRGGVVGYCLAMPLSMRGELPELVPMFEHFARCTYRGRPLAGMRYFVGGQVCVDRAYRGQGLMGRLYQHVGQTAPAAFELCVTEVAVRNPVSVRAHLRIGFEEISRYSDGREDWVVVAWPIGRQVVPAPPRGGVRRRHRATGER